MSVNLRRRQRGVTFIGWVLLLLPTALVLYAGMRVGPAYLNYTKVSRALEGVQKEYGSAGDAASVSRQVIYEAVGKRFNVDMIYSPDLQEVEITKTGGGWQLSVDYEHQIPLFSNVSLLLKFDKSVTIN